MSKELGAVEKIRIELINLIKDTEVSMTVKYHMIDLVLDLSNMALKTKPKAKK